MNSTWFVIGSDRSKKKVVEVAMQIKWTKKTSIVDKTMSKGKPVSVVIDLEAIPKNQLEENRQIILDLEGVDHVICQSTHVDEL